ncbi:hypothetical protein HN588_15720 [Candidatus Bathyarchaeota archaeon]|jgi:hypothetical protein|nr:hypothetical protein [Candidatus Bathyarchaeota archaeon]
MTPQGSRESVACTYLILTDEANLQHTRKAAFFVCGGAFFPADCIGTICQGVERIREAAGYLPGEPFKSASSSKPDRIPMDTFTQAKNDVFELAREMGVRFIAYCVPHEIARNRTDEERFYWGMHATVTHFHRFIELRGVETSGIVVCDQLPFPDKFSLLGEFNHHSGRTVDGQTPHRPLTQLYMFATTPINGSHAASVSDILLGGFRYCVNEPNRTQAAAAIFPKLFPLIWGSECADGRAILESGLIIRPKHIGKPKFRALIDSLVYDLEQLASARIYEDLVWEYQDGYVEG